VYRIKPAGLWLHRKVLLIFLVIALLLGSQAAWAANGFSFIVLGHTKDFYYLPGGREQSSQMRRLVNRRHPGRTVQLYYGAHGLELERLVLGAIPGKPRMEINYAQGWPVRVVSWVQNQPRIVMRQAGRRWVMDQVRAALWEGARNSQNGPIFAVHAGEAVSWGGQGRSLVHSPYWQRFKTEFLDRLPRPDRGLGQPSRVFMTLGRGETNQDPKLEGLLSTLPGLAKTGLSSEVHIYQFGYKPARFIFLDSGPDQSGANWNSCCPDYNTQMTTLEAWLDQAIQQGYRQAFVFMAQPPFCLAGPGLPKSHNPHGTLKRFSDRLGITVISGGVATTEAYEKDGIRYLVLGGGGGPQKLTTDAPKAGHPSELYWQGWERQEEYNYLMVRVEGDKPRFTLHRFRPLSLQGPFSRKTIFK
jgi:hypothetical protein